MAGERTVGVGWGCWEGSGHLRRGRQASGSGWGAVTAPSSQPHIDCPPACLCSGHPDGHPCWVGVGLLPSSLPHPMVRIM